MKKKIALRVKVRNVRSRMKTRLKRETESQEVGQEKLESNLNKIHTILTHQGKITR